MIELSENLFEIVVIAFCFSVSLRSVMRERKRSRTLLALFYAAMLLGNLYWTLYLFFFRRTPQVFYVSELSWLAGFLFLILLLRHYQTDAERAVRSPILWIIPAFVTGMMLFYFKWGDYLLNLADAFLMGILMVRSAQGLIAQGKKPDGRKMLYAVMMAFCLIEYALWTSSCFWMGDTIKNPYFWIGLGQMAVLLLFYKAVDKAESV